MGQTEAAAIMVCCRCERGLHRRMVWECSHDVAKEGEQAGNEAPEHNQDRPGDQADHGVPHAPHRGLQEHEDTCVDERSCMQFTQLTIQLHKQVAPIMQRLLPCTQRRPQPAISTASWTLQMRGRRVEQICSMTGQVNRRM